MRSLIAFALVLAACRGSDRSSLRAAHTASPPLPRGPDALVLRSPRRGGVARVTGYPNVDSTVWMATDAAPSLDHVLAFDADAGLIAGVDTRGYPLWLDLRVGTVTIPSRGKLHGLASVDGTTIYGVGADGAVARFTPSGNAVFKLPLPTRAVFPQLNGTLLVLAGRGDGTRLWRMYPPETRILDSLAAAGVTAGLGSPLGDRVYLLSGGRTLTGVHTRTLARGRSIEFGRRIIAVAATPSGDRFYVLTDSSQRLDVVNRYRDEVSTRIELPGRPRDLRVDPFGHYVLVRAASGDVVWIVGIGTNTVIGTVHTTWRTDVPFVAADGAVAVVHGRDIAFIDVASLREIHRATNGASDFWYPFVWSGFRPRAASLDRPAPVNVGSDTSARVASPALVDTISAAQAMPQPAPRSAPSTNSAKLGFTVSFAALLNESKAREQAARISVDGQSARVVTTVNDGTAVYRVVLGPYATRVEADRVGRASGQTYDVYAGLP